MRSIACAVLALLMLGAGRQTMISLDVRDADITDVIALLASESGQNIVTDGSVKPERVSVHLHDVSFADALAVIVSAHGLQVRRAGKIIVIGSAETMNRQSDASQSALGAQTVILALAHAKADDVAKELTDALSPGTVIVADDRTASVVVTGDGETIARARHIVGALDDSGSHGSSTATAYRLRYVKADDALKQLKELEPQAVALSDEDHNTIVVSGDDAAQSTARSLFNELDRPGSQVLFEVKVADVTPVNEDSNFGIEFGGLDLQGHPTPGSTAYAFAGGAIPINAQLNALMTQGRATILATPKLLTLNNREADLLIGETYPIVFNTSVLGGQNVQFVDIGVKLRLTPTIGDDGAVTAELHPEYSELLDVTSTGYPVIANRKIDSVLRVSDGQTIVLGGLMRDADSQTITKIPGLSSIPVLGKFFENKQSHRERDEIVFLITPHVIFPETPLPDKL